MQKTGASGLKNQVETPPLQLFYFRQKISQSNANFALAWSR